MPGIGPATAERIIAKLRRKMAKFALMMPTEADGEKSDTQRNVSDEVYQILVSLGWSESDARHMLECALESKKKFKDVDALLQAVWDQKGKD